MLFFVSLFFFLFPVLCSCFRLAASVCFLFFDVCCVFVYVSLFLFVVCVLLLCCFCVCLCFLVLFVEIRGVCCFLFLCFFVFSCALFLFLFGVSLYLSGMRGPTMSCCIMHGLHRWPGACATSDHTCQCLWGQRLPIYGWI